MARVTLQTIADRVGVSRMTVSNAFSRPNQLSVELRARILEVADELGYAGPDPAGRALARGTTGAIGVLLTDSLQYAFTDDVATSFLGAVVDAIAPTGLALTLLTASPSGTVLPARDVAIDGAIVYSCYLESESRDWLVRRGLPLVFVDQEPVRGFNSINVDDRAGAKAAAQHIVDLGHRRIGLVTLTIDGERGLLPSPAAASGGYPSRHRMLGWLDALEPAGIEPEVAQAIHNDDRDAEDMATLLLAANDPPTAVLCFSDVLALGVLRVAERLGLHVPNDLSVVGFDDSVVAHRSDPTLTTVRQDIAAKGRLAADALTGAIARARTDAKPRVRHAVLPAELVVRDSTAHVRKVTPRR
jgi:DNA-binding LacI/PurR family transcriptional regulator